MNLIRDSSLKVILPSKRANIYYLEYCRIVQKNGRVLYLNEGKNGNLYWNIPIANTNVILLGNGTSITQASMRILAKAGVLIGFCGGGATPLFSGCEIEWLSPQSEYRPTEYVQNWMKFWFDENKRLLAAKNLQISRIEFIKTIWNKDKDFKEKELYFKNIDLEYILDNYKNKIINSDRISDLLSYEATLTKKLYQINSKICNIKDFSRQHESTDLANNFLNHGNYLAYGLAATTLWVLGIPHGFAVMHGKTRRGALVFDVADLIKDAIVLPLSFICAEKNFQEQEFRQTLLQKFTEHKVLDFMFNKVKNIALKN